MGEYAEQYILDTFGVDISEQNPKQKQKWKWTCPKCGKNLSYSRAQSDHLREKHSESKKGGA